MPVATACSVETFPIATVAECNAAAAELGLRFVSATDIIQQGHPRNNQYTAGCYQASNGLFFNAYGVPGSGDNPNGQGDSRTLCHGLGRPLNVWLLALLSLALLSRSFARFFPTSFLNSDAGRFCGCVRSRARTGCHYPRWPPG